jgi:hypothetical protein
MVLRYVVEAGGGFTDQALVISWRLIRKFIAVNDNTAAVASHSVRN